MFDTIAKWRSPEILQLSDAKHPLHLEVFWNHMDSDPGFWNPRKNLNNEWLAGKSTMNDDVFPIGTWGIFPMSC